MAELPTTVAIIGLGYWGPNRLRVLTEMDEVAVRWLSDRDRTRLERFGRRSPHARTTTEISELLADPELEAVVIATPVFTHHELASAALAAGKHVFVEKPLAASAEQAEELIATAEEGGVTLMTGHTFLYSPPVRLVKDVLDRGELGDVHFISSSRVNLGPYRSDVSAVFDLGPHDFSILRYWLDASPRRIGAVGRAVISPEVADVAFVNLTYGDGLLAHVELSWLSPSKLRRTVIVGSEKMLVYEDGAAEPVRIFDSSIHLEDSETFGEYQLSYRTGDIVSLRVDATEPITAELRDFVRCVRGGGRPISDSDLALDVIRTIEAAELSMSRAGAPVDLRPSGETTRTS